MAQVEVVARRDMAAKPDDVLDAIADYRQTHPRLLPEQFKDYEVREGGDGEGTVLFFRLHATSKRVRECLMDVTEPTDDTVVETDRNSTLVTTWTVVPGEGAEGARSRVTIRSTWQGAGGIGGVFERIFAPRALAAIYDQVLANLAAEVEKPAG
ncbi:SRPBCC family protein [Streptomyces sp. URMC 129]|uniref:SRPBCC family protein n=1 Tax=Streptomyces sp. URMC 129 TaxID=3423407 RepID=UPI003F1B35CA